MSSNTSLEEVGVGGGGELVGEVEEEEVRRPPHITEYEDDGSHVLDCIYQQQWSTSSLQNDLLNCHAIDITCESYYSKQF